MTELDIIIEEVEAFNQAIKDDLDSKNFTDTGRAKNSLRIEVDKQNQKVSSIGAHYIEFLNRGTGVWKGDEEINVNLLAYILEKTGWYERKVTNKKISVWAIAHSIVTKGNRVHRDIRKGIELEEKVKELTQNLTKRLAKAAAKRVLVQLNEAHKNLRYVS